MIEVVNPRTFTSLFTTGAVCSNAHCSNAWLLRRVKSEMFNPYRLDNGQFVWTDTDLREVIRRKRQENFGLKKGPKK